MSAPTAEEPTLNSIKRKTPLGARLTALACASICACVASAAWAQRAAKDVGASMVQPPQAPVSGADARNPDNMPIKRPQKPTNDPIARRPPASSTKPK